MPCCPDARLLPAGQGKENVSSIMWILIIALVALGVVAAVAGAIRNRRLRQKVESGELDAMPEPVEVDAECCGQHGGVREGEPAGGCEQAGGVL